MIELGCLARLFLEILDAHCRPPLSLRELRISDVQRQSECSSPSPSTSPPLVCVVDASRVLREKLRRNAVKRRLQLPNRRVATFM